MKKLLLVLVLGTYGCPEVDFEAGEALTSCAQAAQKRDKGKKKPLVHYWQECGGSK